MILCEGNLAEVETLKFILRWFEICSGLNINYDKCELMGIRMDSNSIQALANIFRCKVGSFPSKYLGLPVYGFSKEGFMGPGWGEI